MRLCHLVLETVLYLVINTRVVSATHHDCNCQLEWIVRSVEYSEVILRVPIVAAIAEVQWQQLQVRYWSVYLETNTNTWFRPLLVTCTDSVLIKYMHQILLVKINILPIIEGIKSVALFNFVFYVHNTVVCKVVITVTNTSYWEKHYHSTVLWISKW